MSHNSRFDSTPGLHILTMPYNAQGHVVFLPYVPLVPLCGLPLEIPLHFQSSDDFYRRNLRDTARRGASSTVICAAGSWSFVHQWAWTAATSDTRTNGLSDSFPAWQESQDIPSLTTDFNGIGSQFEEFSDALGGMVVPERNELYL